MAFEEKDTEAVVPNVTQRDRVTSIEIIRDDRILGPSVPLRIVAHKEVTVNGKLHSVLGRLPQAKIDAGWPGTARTLKDTLFTIVGNVVWDT